MNKVLSILLIIAMIVAMGTTSVFAAGTAGTTELIKPDGLTSTVDPTAQTTITTVGSRIMGTIQVVGVIVAVVILMVIGIKYMMGSAEEKAEYKKTMIPYIIGAILIFGASTIANLAFNIATSLAG